jgi:hypothetical protein
MDMYEKRAVLFLDILGFSELVQSGKERRLLAALQHVQGRAIEAHEGGKVAFTAFSDCIVVSTPLLAGSGALRLVKYARLLALDLLSRGFLTRGAVVVGDLYQEEGIVLGPALVTAYHLESKKALYPRILATSELRQAVAEWCASCPPQNSPQRATYFREDFDGAFHIDLFEYGGDAPEAYWGGAEQDPGFNGTAFRDACLTFIEKIFSVQPAGIAEEKYAWMARYFFEKCECHLWPLPANLPISEGKRLYYEQQLHDIHIADAYDRKG